MADLTTIEKKKLERYFDMGGGYFINLSNADLEELVADELNIEIYDDKYNLKSGSKANRIRAFWQLENNHTVAKFLTAAIARDDFEKENSFSYTGNTNKTLRDECIQIVERLKGMQPQPLSQPYPAIQELNLDKSTMKNKVFIVHGHDELVKEKVARFVAQVGLDPIILHEQFSGSKTIVEKIEHYADQACYAIVLYTPCDRGAKANEKSPKYRARQNVVFEHGYFIGKLGRDKVTAVVKGDIELPNDFSGVVYEKFDDTDSWKLALAKEMRGGGCEIDLNALA